MGKNIYFFGQPIFSQLFSFVDKTIVYKVKTQHQSDRYYKKFDTWQHLVTMLFCCFSGATSLRELSKNQSVDDIDLPDDKDHEIIKDETITIKYTANGHEAILKLRRVVLWDDTKSKIMVFLTNNFDQQAATIAGIYKYRWQIELLIKKLKQNFLLKYFLGDNQNAIEIQIWCSLICLLLMEVVRKTIKRKWAFSNMVALVRFHMVSYVHLINFLNNPEKALKESINHKTQISLFPT